MNNATFMTSPLEGLLSKPLHLQSEEEIAITVSKRRQRQAAIARAIEARTVAKKTKPEPTTPTWGIFNEQ